VCARVSVAIAAVRGLALQLAGFFRLPLRGKNKLESRRMPWGVCLMWNSMNAAGRFNRQNVQN
jgi:hypothetical protein